MAGSARSAFYPMLRSSYVRVLPVCRVAFRPLSAPWPIKGRRSPPVTTTCVSEVVVAYPRREEDIPCRGRACDRIVGRGLWVGSCLKGDLIGGETGVGGLTSLSCFNLGQLNGIEFCAHLAFNTFIQSTVSILNQITVALNPITFVFAHGTKAVGVSEANLFVVFDRAFDTASFTEVALVSFLCFYLFHCLTAQTRPR